MENTTEQVHKNKIIPPNPEGKGGFGDNPENRNPGGWKKEDSISYQYNKLLRLSEKDFKKWQQDNPEDERTVAQSLAYSAVIEARKKLDYLKEVTDRTEGKAKQTVKYEGELDTGIKDLADTLQRIYDDTNPETPTGNQDISS